MQNPNYISNFLKRLGNIPYANYNTVAEQEYQNGIITKKCYDALKIIL